MFVRPKRYAYPVAYVKALKSKLLTGGSLDRLLKARDDAEAIRQLLETPYRPYLAGLTKGHFTGADLDNALLKSYDAIFRLLLKISGGTTAYELLRLTYAWQELQSLKFIIRSVFEGRALEESMKDLIPFGAYDYGRCVKLLRSRGVSDVIQDVRERKLRERLSGALKEALSSRTTLPLEAAVDEYMAQRIWAIIEKLPKEDRRPLVRLVGSELDIANVMIVLRGKMLGLQRERISKFMLRPLLRLGEDLIRALEAPSVLDALRALSEGYYSEPLKESLKQIGGGAGLGVVDHHLTKYLVKLTRLTFVGYPFHAGTLYAFLKLKYYEIQDLRRIVLGKKALIPEQELRPALLLTGAA